MFKSKHYLLVVVQKNEGDDSIIHISEPQLNEQVAEILAKEFVKKITKRNLNINFKGIKEKEKLYKLNFEGKTYELRIVQEELIPYNVRYIYDEVEGIAGALDVDLTKEEAQMLYETATSFDDQDFIQTITEKIDYILKARKTKKS